jgi:preprotein translocase subunit YajC
MRRGVRGGEAALSWTETVRAANPAIDFAGSFAKSARRIRPLRFAAGACCPREVFVITPAFAQGAPGAGGADIIMSLVPFILIFVIMWFLIIRPQQKRMKEHREMISNVRRGDTIVTGGGLIGKVTKVIDDGEVEAEIADGVKVRFVKTMIQDVRAKGEPVKEAAKG